LKREPLRRINGVGGGVGTTGGDKLTTPEEPCSSLGSDVGQVGVKERNLGGKKEREMICWGWRRGVLKDEGGYSDCGGGGGETESGEQGKRRSSRGGDKNKRREKKSQRGEK